MMKRYLKSVKRLKVGLVKNDKAPSKMILADCGKVQLIQLGLILTQILLING